MTTTTCPPARSRLRIVGGLLVAQLVAALLVVTFSASPAAAGPPPVMYGYIPWPANDMRAAMASVNNGAGTTLDFTVGITNAASGSVMYYDHWEDGFEADAANPVQASTLVFGDAVTTNGNAATFCSTCAGDLLPQGAALVMRNNITTPRDIAQIRFDGGDRLGSTRGFAITAGGFTTSVGSLLATVASAYDTSIYAFDYTVPVGEDTPVPSGTSDAFSFTGVSVMAAQAGTVVEIDTDADGVVDLTQTVGEGQTAYVNGGLNEGATIHASAPVQVHVATGQRGSSYESRWFTLFPDELLSNDYMSPAGSSVNNFRTVNYLYNPSDTAIDVTPTCTGCSGTVSVPANASAAFHSPTGQAVRFTSTGAPFIAVAGVGAQSGAAPGNGTDDSASWDWGFTMIPTSQLTTQVVLGWAPGNSNNPPSSPAGNRNDGPVWVTSLTATTLRVDLDGNPATGTIASADCFGARHDLEISVAALASTRIHDSVDGDMTSARIYTCDGTVIAGAWGEDAANAPTGSPGFDAGYTIIPTTTMVVEKTAGLATDTNGDGGFSPGDVITYEIAIADAGSLAFTSVNARDVLPEGTEYVPGSTTLDNNTTVVAIPDDVVPPAGTVFPLDENGTSLPSINAGQTVYLRFDALVVTPYLAASTILENTACVSAVEGADCDTTTTELVSADLSLTKDQTGSPQFVGDEATFEITVRNAGPDGATAVEVTDVLPAGLTFVSAAADQGAYDDATGVWTVGDLADGGSAILEIVATVDVDTPVENFAEITSAQAADPDSQPGENPLGPTDPADQDDEDSAALDVAPRVDLELEKAVTDGPTSDGTTEFTLTLHNRFAVDATNVTVEDYAPAGATFVSAVAGLGSFDSATDVWTIATMPGDSSTTLVLTYQLADFPAVNRAEVIDVDQVDIDSEPAEDPLDDSNPPNEDDEAEVPVDSTFIDLSLTKTMTVGPDFLGEAATFEIVVTNDGPADATGVTVADLLPAGMSFVSASATTGTYDDATGIWTIGDLADGGSTTLTVTATMDVVGPVNNVAEVSAADQPDADSTPDNDDPGEDDQDAVTLSVLGASIGDRVWDDVDADGFQDPAETGLNGITVRLLQDTDGDGSYETVVGSVVTSGDGGYGFSELPAGDYRVDVLGSSLPVGVLATTAEPQDVQLSGGESIDTVDFGYVASASVGDRVWNDLDGDGTQDPGEPGLVGVTVTLLRDVDGDGSYETTVDSTVTAAAGSYSFGSLLPGDYRVDVDGSSLPAGVLATTAEPQDVTLEAGDAVDTVDFGYVAGASVGDRVWEDLDADGVQDGSEAGIDGVTVQLLQDVDGDGTYETTVASTVTAGDGAYSFDGLFPGDYRVVVDGATVPSGYVATTATAFDVALAAGDDVDTADAGFRAEADLQLTKTETASPDHVGDGATFEITVSNDGPATATGVEVGDVLPTGLTFTAATATQGSYDEATGVWTVGTLAVGASATLTVDATVDVDTAVTNTAQVTAVDQPDPDSTPDNDDPQEDDQDDAVVDVDPLVDLSLTKVVTASPTFIGDGATFEIVVTNDGPSAASGVEVSDVLPAGLTFVSASATAGSYDDATGVWTVGGLAVGASATLTIDSVVTVESVTNTAEVSAANEDDVDSTPGNDEPDEDDQASVDVIVEPLVDLSLTKVVSGSPTYLGEEATFEIVVTNDGPSAASGVEVSDVLPAGLTFVSASTATGSYDDATGVWTVGGLAVGASATLEITARVDALSVTNTAEVSAANEDDVDSTPGNDEPDEDDQASVDVIVEPLVDLSLTKVVSGSPTYLGEEATFEIVVTNDGPSAASGVEVSDVLPAGLTFVSASTATGSYDDATGVWTVGGLAVGASATLEITARVDALSVTNTAEVSAANEDDVDSTPGNDEPDEDDQASVDVTVEPLVDLELSKSETAGPTHIGDVATFVVTVLNRGPSAATDVEVTDLLPAGLEYASSTVTQGSYDEVTGIWTVGGLAVDASATLTIDATVTVGTVVNVAEVTAVNEDDVDSVPAENPLGSGNPPDQDDEDEAEVAVAALVDLSLTKVVSGSPTYLGEEATFEIVVTNDGPSAASGVEVSDVLPAGLTFVSASTATGSYDDATGVWTVGGLAVGASATLEITARVDALSVTNTAEVSAANEDDVDSTPGNDEPDEDDQASVDVTVEPLVDLSLTKDLSTTPTYLSDTAVFSVTLVNDGPSDATGVAVTDQLPAGLTYVSDDGAGSYDPVTGVWTVGSIAAGGSRTIEITVTVDVLVVENFAEITAVNEDDVDSAPAENPFGPDDPADQDDEDSQPVEVAPLIDLSLVKTADPAIVEQLDEATFTITVSNDGPSDASGIEVTDLLPAGVAFVSDAPSQGSYDAVTGVWTVGTIAVGGSVTLDITVQVLDAGTIVNTAEVTAANEDDRDSTPDNDDAAEDDQDSASLSSDPLIDLSVSKTVSSPTALVGSDVTYTVSVTNDGPSDATGVEVADVLPAGLTYGSDSPTQGDYDPATGVWTVGDLATDATASLEITVTVTAAGPILNVTEVSAAVERDVDSEPVENPLGPEDAPDQDDEAEVEVIGVQIDLELTKVADVTEVNVGGDVTYTVTLTNQGPSDATGVAVADLLPTGLTFVDATPQVGTFDAPTGVWTIGDLDLDETVTLQLVATVEQAGPITNVAEVTTAGEPDVDSTPGNDDPTEDDQDEVTVVGLEADLSLTKDVDDTSPDLGSEVTYTLVLSNAGPSTATNIVVVDELPSGVTWVSDSSGGAYDPATGRWSIPTLAVGASATLEITVRTTATGAIVNRASVVDVDQPDPDSTPDNDDPTEDDEDSVTIVPQPASVSGTIWLDADGDRTFDDDEHPIAGVVVLLLDSDGGLVASTVTDADGGYLFDGLPPGTYTIAVDPDSLPAEVAGQSVDPDSVLDGRHSVTLAAGDNVVDIDFAYVPVQEPVDPPDPSDPPPVEASPGTTLPVTGGDPIAPAGLGLLLVAAGWALLAARRRFGPTT